jgi:cysteine-rich repeat protein
MTRRSWLTLLVIAACTDAETVVDPAATAVDVVVHADASLGVDQLRVMGTVGMTEAFAPGLLPEAPRVLSAEESFAILLPSTLDGKQLTVRIDGLAAGTAITAGAATVTVHAGEVSHVEVVLGDRAVCGDGMIRTPLETCDDRDAAAGDGCSATCLVEPGWTCVGPPAGPSSCQVDTTACNDGIDNDGDGLTDGADPGCDGITDGDEHGAGACDDGIDNDDDGRIDFKPGNTGDPGCTSPSDDSEHCSGTGTQCKQCDDGLDNDGDGTLDFRIDGTGDPQCTGINDNNEA